MSSQAKTSSLIFRKCTLIGDLDIHNVQTFNAYGCDFFNRNYFAGEIPAIEIQTCRFKLKFGGGNDYKPPFNLSFRDLQAGLKTSMEIFNCNFYSTGNEMGLDFFATNFRYLNFQKNTFEVPVYLYLAQMDRLIVENSKFTKPLDMREIGLMTNATNLRFDQLSGKIGIKDTFHSTYHFPEKLYQAVDEKELSHEKNFNELIAVYSKLLGVYK